MSQLHSLEFQQTNNVIDINLKPAGGIRPTKLKIEEVIENETEPEPPNAAFRLLSIKELARAEQESSTKVKDGLNAVPTGPVEEADCSCRLTPNELHQIIIGPPTIDFGEVCLKSVSEKCLNIVNNLEQFIHVIVELDCRELRHTSPLAQVVPPRSKAFVPLIFESNSKGPFQRSLHYTINGCYGSHITVFATVAPVALELSTSHLYLEPFPGLPAEAGVRGVITLCNKLNYPAEFTWTPILGKRGTAFSIRPATGMVDAFHNLDCEVVFHPSFLAPEHSEFNIQVHGGNNMTLKCSAKIGMPQVQLIDKRMSFGQVPLNLTTTKIAKIRNSGAYHAYFQVLETNPIPGLKATPENGVIPSGGFTEITLSMTPTNLIKFDARINVAIRGGRVQEIRIGGAVEAPCVNIDIPSFNIGGVYCGSAAAIPFTLSNQESTEAKVEFILTRYADFSVEFPPKKQTAADLLYQEQNPGLFVVSLDDKETIECKLVFKPTEVAAYEFLMPVTINNIGVPPPPNTPFPASPHPAKESLTYALQHPPRPTPSAVHTPSKKVVATALRMPLLLSDQTINFYLSPVMHEMASNTSVGHSKGTLMVNNTKRRLKWALDLSKSNSVLDDGIFKFLHPGGMPYLTYGDRGINGELDPGEAKPLQVLFCPAQPGRYEVTLPLIIDNDHANPYQQLTLIGVLKAPCIKFEPDMLVLTAVPLMMPATAQITVTASDYKERSELKVTVPQVVIEDGSTVSPVAVNFVGEKYIRACKVVESEMEAEMESCVLTCTITFQSNNPVSFTENIVFEDDLGNSFFLPVTVTADNCLLTCYPFIAHHRSDHQIVCEQGMTLKGRKSRESTSVGEAVLRPIAPSPCNNSTSRPSTEATTSFDMSSSSYEPFQSSTSVTDETFTPETPREDAANNIVSKPELEQVNDDSGRRMTTTFGLMFPDEESDEGIFHKELLYAVQRWFSSQGWPDGPNPITVPESLRSGITKNAGGGGKGTGAAGQGMKRIPTIYDMIAYLCGRPVPGIPVNNPMPADYLERVKQVHWQHNTLLIFLRSQGASVSSVKPEYLMTPDEYLMWMELQRELEEKKGEGGFCELKVGVQLPIMPRNLFEVVSKKAWTDVLLQLLKTLVLAKVTPKQFKTLPSPYKDTGSLSVDPDPLCSNIYSVSERILLLWLNHHYEHQRTFVWQTSPKGTFPPSRWIVNFDFDLLDGLVIATTLAAHAPFLVESHLSDMYTHPKTAEECLHNALKIINALRFLRMDYDIQAIDITDPNPVTLLLLCLHLYNHLPNYIAKSTVEFSGALHSSVQRQVRLTNPSAKMLTYTALITGHDRQDFWLPKGDIINIPRKAKAGLTIEFRSRFLRSAKAVLILVGKRLGATIGSTLVFNLCTQIDNIKPKASVKCETPCYSLTKVAIEVKNPFPYDGEFRIVLVESKAMLISEEQGAGAIYGTRKRPVKSVTSRINHGQRKSEVTTTGKEKDTLEDSKPQPALLQQLQEDRKTLSVFFSQKPTVYLPANKSAQIVVNFLPYEIGKRQCSIIFVNENIGEFLYAIEGVSTMPLPLPIPFKPMPGSIRISSAVAAAGGGNTSFRSSTTTIYWKCDVGMTVKEKLHVPIINTAREKALILAAQLQMSDLEKERRQRTDTLSSGGLVTKALKMLSAASDQPEGMARNEKGDRFDVEIDSKLFSAPSNIYIPNPLYRASVNDSNDGKDNFMELPITFTAHGAGQYPCNILLRSNNDVRIFHIECTVIPEGSETQIEFTSPVHQPITQDLPIVNQSSHEWPMQVAIDGAGFVGPTTFVAKAFQTTNYPLMFRPQHEGHVQGHIVLTNTVDGIDHTFHLVGKGEKPLPLDSVVFDCRVKETVRRTLQIPNSMKRKLFFEVECDIECLSGADSILVLSGQTGIYEVSVTPLRRGTYNGVLAFVARRNPKSTIDSDGDEMPDEDEDVTDPASQEYRIWFAVEINVEPQPPERIMYITSPCQRKVALELNINNRTDKVMFTFIHVTTLLLYQRKVTLELNINNRTDKVMFTFIHVTTLLLYQRKVALELNINNPTGKVMSGFIHVTTLLYQRKVALELNINNPTDKVMSLEADIVGPSLSGPNYIHIPPDSKGVYELTYAPAIIGSYQGSLILYNKMVGEFWYDLKLEATSPLPVTLPVMECELGRYIEQPLNLTNPTDEKLILIPMLSNTNNFSLERNTKSDIITLMPRQSVTFTLKFMPSALGDSDHSCRISFYSEQLGEWVFLASGMGQLPQEQDAVSVTAPAAINSTIIIPFRNPTDTIVKVEVKLTALGTFQPPPSNDGTKSDTTDLILEEEESPFSLLMKQTEDIEVGPKSTLDIPVSFSPDDMSKKEAIVTIAIRRWDGKNWEYEFQNKNVNAAGSDGKPLSGGVQQILWTYPIRAFPEVKPTSDVPPVEVRCQARMRIEERLEVLLAGMVPSSAGLKRGTKPRPATPDDKDAPNAPENVVIGETLSGAPAFTYEIIYANDDAQNDLSSAVALTFVRHLRDRITGLVMLVFNIIFSPYKMMNYNVELFVQSALGGQWRFPLQFIATEAAADDTIVVETAGLNKESSVGFRLFSQTSHPVPYAAFFVEGSDSDFRVLPQTGELLPASSNGTLITVTFLPQKYGKLPRAKLVVQTMDMQWTYNIQGALPAYAPPHGTSYRPMAGPHPDLRKRHHVNFVKQNLHVITTAVSSPLKGGPVVRRTKFRVTAQPTLSATVHTN
ncbi:Cilia- and flagella-associated protein 47 [Lamellibrachia satsuma]|nr:Cilia- and flagella-associated protein 47 [Lamellibrachia satsuma]